MHLCIQLSPWSPCASWGDQMTLAIWEEKLSKKTEPGTYSLSIFFTSSSLPHLQNFNMKPEASQIAEDRPKEKVR